MNNKRLGNRFETEMCNILAKHGYWVHLFAPNQAGQPADIIAVKNHIAHLIDCKVCSNGFFDTNRIEDNQHFAMTLWRERGNGEGLFAFKIEDEIYLISYNVMQDLKQDFTKLPARIIKYVGERLEEWIS